MGTGSAGSICPMATDTASFKITPPRPAYTHPAIEQHAVQFYEDDDFLLESVTRLMATGIGDGDCAIVVATAEHRAALDARLLRRGLDMNAARRRGAYVALDAEETLTRFMVGNAPDPEKFHDVVGSLIERSLQGPPLRRVRIFGEMVALLWAEGNAAAAIELERLWNDLTERKAFSLLCAYPMKAFAAPGQAEGFAAVGAAHGHVSPTERYVELDPDDRLRAVAVLEQRVAALEAELATKA